MKATYLLINLLTIAFPIALSFDKKVHFAQYWRHLFPAIGLSGLLFLVWDVLFTKYGVWSFNARYVLGWGLQGLPFEELLFFVTVPFACVFIYECIRYYFPQKPSALLVNMSTSALLAYSALMLFLYPDRLYTFITFGLCLALCLVVLWLKPVWLGQFYGAFLVSLLPFYLVNGLLTSLPVVLYNNAQNCGFRIGTIPFEDHFYSFDLLLLTLFFYERFKKQA
ncbi:MAG: lycopene cyclase domain-containing protein [Sphingobacteriaceae bacterium]